MVSFFKVVGLGERGRKEGARGGERKKEKKREKKAYLHTLVSKAR